LEWLKFGESGSQTFWWIKVWQITTKLLNVLWSHGKLADESLANFINLPNPPNFSHSKLLSFTVWKFTDISVCLLACMHAHYHICMMSSLCVCLLVCMDDVCPVCVLADVCSWLLACMCVRTYLQSYVCMACEYANIL